MAGSVRYPKTNHFSTRASNLANTRKAVSASECRRAQSRGWLFEGPKLILLFFRSTQIHRTPILLPLLFGAITTLCAIVIHAVPLSATVSFVRREKKLGRMAKGFWTDTGIVSLTILSALAAHLVEIALWALVFMMCREFSDFGTAYYHSAVNYTSLGYGDLIMTPTWRLLGPLETANGMLLFGVSTAMIFALIQRLVETRFADLRDGR
jgi:hypothetical protein